MPFDVLLDILESSRQVSWVDFEEETKWTKGAIHSVFEPTRIQPLFELPLLRRGDQVSLLLGHHDLSYQKRHL